MSSGFKYNLNQGAVAEELYDVQSGHRKHGAYKLDTTGLTSGITLPNLTPVFCDKKGLCKVVKNFKVAENCASDATTLKIAKGSLIAVGMTICDGNTSVEVSAIDSSNASYDSLTISKPFGVAVSAGAIVYEAVARLLNIGVTDDVGATGTSVKVEHGSGCYVGMKLTNGTTVTTVTAISEGAQKDTLTISPTLGALTGGTSKLDETGATAKKNVANFLAYGSTKVESGALLTLLMQAYEIQESKLVLPITEADKEGLTSRFQFD